MNKELPRLKSLIGRGRRCRFIHHFLLASFTLLLLPDSAAAATKAGEPPMIDAQPIGRTVTEGGHVALSVLVQGSAPFSYRWWKNDRPLTNGVRLVGATNAVLNIDPVQSADSGEYSVVVTNSEGSITSAIVSVTVSQILFQITAVGGTGAWVTVFGEIGDVYRIEVSTNFNPYFTNGYATNVNGRAQFFDRDTSGGFRQLRVRFNHMLPVLYPGPAQLDVVPLRSKAMNAAPGSLLAYGKLNQVWRFESSRDFSRWFPIGTVTNTTGWVKFHDPRVDPNDVIPPHQFYRIAPP